MLQESGTESVVKTVGMLQSHSNYFNKTDVANFIIMKVHNLKVSLKSTGVYYGK